MGHVNAAKLLVMHVRCLIFGMAFSSHVRSRIFRAMLKLIVKDFIGTRRWTVDGKYSSDVEKVVADEGLFSFRLLVKLLSSKAMVKPEIVTRIAVVFRYHGITDIKYVKR